MRSHTLAPTTICDFSHSLCMSPLTDLGHISSVTYVCHPLWFVCGHRKGTLKSPLSSMPGNIFCIKESFVIICFDIFLSSNLVVIGKSLCIRWQEIAHLGPYFITKVYHVNRYTSSFITTVRKHKRITG